MEMLCFYVSAAYAYCLNSCWLTFVIYGLDFFTICRLINPRCNLIHNLPITMPVFNHSTAPFSFILSFCRNSRSTFLVSYTSYYNGYVTVFLSYFILQLFQISCWCLLNSMLEYVNFVLEFMTCIMNSINIALLFYYSFITQK